MQIRTLAWIAVVTFVPAAVPLLINGGSASVLTAANFAPVGTYRMPAGVGHFTTNVTAMTGGNIGGVDHLFFTQYVGGKPVPLETAADHPPSPPNDWGAATRLTCVQDWGITATGCAGGSAYDPFGGKFCNDFDADGKVVNNGGLLSGLGYHEGYFYVSCGGSYGNYRAQWHLLGTQLIGPGNTPTSGPWRVCEGDFPDGSGTQSCGPRRSGWLFECPIGMCDGVIGGATQDAGQNYGDAFFGFKSWPTASTPSGFGSPRGRNPAYRTTDLIADHDLLAHGNLTSAVSPTTGRITTRQNPNEAMRRPPIGGAPPYLWQGYLSESHTAESYVDPSQYGGVGTWVPDGDVLAGAAYIDVGAQRGYVGFYQFSVHARWYRTTAATEDTLHHVIFDRSVSPLTREARWIMPNGGTPNARLYFDGVAANQHYTIALVNPGADHGSATCSASGVAVTVALKTDSKKKILSTANDVIAAIADTAACHALLTAANYAGDGTGIVAPLAAQLLAQGPILSPIGAYDCAVVVTGPCSDDNDVFLGIYEPNDLEKIPDWTPQPSSLFKVDNVAVFHWTPKDLTGEDTNRYNHAACGMWYSSVTHRMYLCGRSANTNEGGSLIHVIQVSAAASTDSGLSSWLRARVPGALKHR